MNKIPFKLLLIILMVGVGLATAYFVFAEVSTGPKITYPVVELNNCKSETECRAYCDKPDNISVCADFAKKNGLMSEEEANRAKQFKDVAQIAGPGGCKGQDQCETYCGDQSHIDECVSFAEKHNLMSPDDLAEAKKVSEALKQGAKLPGNCQGKKQCEAYCKTPEHSGEGIDFAEKAGFIQPDQAGPARKMLELVKSGDAPQECLGGKDQCQQFCSEPSHRDQCAGFMVKAGFMKQEDADIFKKTGGKGPGDCQSKDECDAFCKVKENQKICFQFGKDNGLIPEDKIKQLEEGSQKIKVFIDNAPAEVKQCLESAVGPDVLQEIESGTFMPGQETGNQVQESMKKCFENLNQNNTKGPASDGQGGGVPGSSNSGGGEHNGFTECGIVDGAVADYVCGTNGNSRGSSTGAGVETTYFNECHAKQQGAQILHKGACGKQDCPDIAHPVCGTDGNSWTSACNAEKAGAKVKHDGLCTKEDFGGGSGGGEREMPPANNMNNNQFKGPGGCSSAEECNKYCSDPSHFNECAKSGGENKQDSQQQQQHMMQQQQQSQQQNQNQQDGQQQFQGNPDSNNNFGQPPSPENGGGFMPPNNQGGSPSPSPVPSGDISEQRSFSGIFKAMILETFKILH